MASYLNSSGDFKVECPTRENLTQNYRDFKRTFVIWFKKLDEQHGEVSVFHVENLWNRGLIFNGINQWMDIDVMGKEDITKSVMEYIKSICCSGSFDPLMPYFEKFLLYLVLPETLFLAYANAAGTLMKPSYYLIKSGDGFRILLQFPYAIKHFKAGADGMSEYVFRFITPNILDPNYYQGQGDSQEMEVRYFISEIGDYFFS